LTQQVLIAECQYVSKILHTFFSKYKLSGTVTTSSIEWLLA